VSECDLAVQVARSKAQVPDKLTARFNCLVPNMQVAKSKERLLKKLNAHFSQLTSQWELVR